MKVRLSHGRIFTAESKFVAYEGEVILHDSWVEVWNEENKFTAFIPREHVTVVDTI